MIVLDTNICIAYLNNHAGVVARMREAVEAAEQIAVPSVVVSELFYGAYKSVRVSENVRRLHKFLIGVDVLVLGRAAARRAGRIKAELNRLGRPTGRVDLLIAATAVRFDATLVTHNVRHVEHVPHLKVDDRLR